ncbi:MAG: DoxX family protein [Phycisphaeraceae bacterium]
MNPLRINFVLLINRLALGLYFFFAGYEKVFNVGVGTFFEKTYKPNVPDWLPQFIATPYGYAVPFLEMIAGAALAVGLFGRIAALLVAALLVSFMLAMGVSGAGGTFDKNIVFATLAIMLVITGPGTLSIDRFLPGRKKSAPKVPVK